MFLIEYNDGYFINAEEIKEIWFNKDDIYFSIKNDNETSYKVGDDYRYTFLNNIDGINKNFKICQRYNVLNKVT